MIMPGRCHGPGCRVGGCEKPGKRNGRVCSMHLERYRKHRSYDLPVRDKDAEALTRLLGRAVLRGACLLYEAGYKQHAGHRRIGFRGRHYLAHRVAWILQKGPIPDGLFVCHRCDVPNCINVDHLFLGTAADNNHDRDAKGRHTPLRGSRSGTAKLAEWQVVEIKKRLGSGEKIRLLAEDFAVSMGAISSIKYGRNWAHVRVDPQVPNPDLNRRPA